MNLINALYPIVNRFGRLLCIFQTFYMLDMRIAMVSLYHRNKNVLNSRIYFHETYNI